jgi:hypothetical protein
MTQVSVVSYPNEQSQIAETQMGGSPSGHSRSRPTRTRLGGGPKGDPMSGKAMSRSHDRFAEVCIQAPCASSCEDGRLRSPVCGCFRFHCDVSRSP